MFYIANVNYDRICLIGTYDESTGDLLAYGNTYTVPADIELRSGNCCAVVENGRVICAEYIGGKTSAFEEPHRYLVGGADDPSVGDCSIVEVGGGVLREPLPEVPIYLSDVPEGSYTLRLPGFAVRCSTEKKCDVIVVGSYYIEPNPYRPVDYKEYSSLASDILSYAPGIYRNTNDDVRAALEFAKSLVDGL